MKCIDCLNLQNIVDKKQSMANTMPSKYCQDKIQDRSLELKNRKDLNRISNLFSLNHCMLNKKDHSLHIDLLQNPNNKKEDMDSDKRCYIGKIHQYMQYNWQHSNINHNYLSTDRKTLMLYQYMFQQDTIDSKLRCIHNKEKDMLNNIDDLTNNNLQRN